MAGIKDVAKMAGVGVGTVSRMLNDSGYVSLDTRAKIEAAMKELNYTPNELARNLYYKKSGIIAVLVPNVSNPFFAEFVDCVEGELRKAGFKIMLCNTLKDVKAEAEYLDLLNRHIVDGIIAGMSSLDEMKYSFAAITQQHFCCQASTHFMVHSYYRNFFSQISVKRNNRLMNFRILTFIQRRHSGSSCGT